MIPTSRDRLIGPFDMQNLIELLMRTPYCMNPLKINIWTPHDGFLLLKNRKLTRLTNKRSKRTKVQPHHNEEPTNGF